MLCSLLLVGVLFLSSAPSRAACGDGALQTADMLYGAEGSYDEANIYVLNPDTGLPVRTLGPVIPLTGLAVNPLNGELFGVTSSEIDDPGLLLHINEVTGAVTLVGDLFPNSDSIVTDIAFAPDGTLYGWNKKNLNDLVTIDINNGGLATPLDDSGLTGGEGNGLAMLDGDNLFLANTGVNGHLTLPCKPFPQKAQSFPLSAEGAFFSRRLVKLYATTSTVALA